MLKDWAMRNLALIRGVLLAFAVLNVWSGYALISAHPHFRQSLELFLGLANFATAVILVGIVVAAWNIEGKP